MSDVPWPFAGRVARRIAGTYPLVESYHRARLQTELPPLVERASELVATETRLQLPGVAQVVVVSRGEWAERNLSSFARILELAERRIAERLANAGVGALALPLARRLIAAETGALLGLLSRRVLGQYELVLPSGDEADSVAFVGANILAMERTHQFRPAEFRLWIALHEAAHRAQFVAVPWMRGYFFSLVEEMVEGAQPEPGRLGRVVEQVRGRLRRGEPPVDETGLLGLFASPTQRQTLDRVQALMSVLEGHGHVVMDRVGARALRSQERMSRILKARRNDPRTAAFFRLTGLEMKLRQYELGERFVRRVERIAGWEALDQVWSSPEALPTPEEVENPRRWLDRIA